MVPKIVTAVFVRTGQILELCVRGQLIRTTPEHPFWTTRKVGREQERLRLATNFWMRTGSWSLWRIERHRKV